MERGGAVYIITNETHTVLYTGVTSDLLSRMTQHRNKEYPNSFSSKYNCFMLVYYCVFSTIEEAIAEEKRIKAGNRQAKMKRIESINPEWKDLYPDLLSTW